MAEAARLDLDLEDSPYVAWRGIASVVSASTDDVMRGTLLPAHGDRAVFLWARTDGSYGCQVIDALEADGVTGGAGPVQTFVPTPAWLTSSAYRELTPLKFQAARLSSGPDGDRYVIGEGGWTWAVNTNFIASEPLITRLLLVYVPVDGTPVVEDVATFDGLIRRNAAGVPIFARNWIRLAGDGALGHVLCARQGLEDGVVHTVSQSGGQLVIGAEHPLECDFVGPVTNPGGTGLDPNTNQQEPILAQQSFYLRMPEGFGSGLTQGLIALRFADEANIAQSGAPGYVASTLGTGYVLIGAMGSGDQAATATGLPRTQVKVISGTTGAVTGTVAPPADLTLRGAGISGQGWWGEIKGSLLNGATFYASAVRSDDAFVVAELQVSPASVAVGAVLPVDSAYQEASVVSTSLGPAILNPSSLAVTFQSPDEAVHQLLVDAFGIAPYDKRLNFSPLHPSGSIWGIDFKPFASMVAGETGIFTAIMLDDRNAPPAVALGFLGDFPPEPVVPPDGALTGLARVFKTARFG